MLHKLDLYETINYTKVPLALIKEGIWDTKCNIIDDGCAYVCAPLKVK